MDIMTYLKVSKILPKLPELMRRVRRLEKAAGTEDKEPGNE